MGRVLVLGGCGAVGRVAVRTLVGLKEFEEVVIGDINYEQAKTLAEELGQGAVAQKVDVLDSQSLKSAISGADLVLNCVGPFYKFVKPILQAVIEARVNYLDICDDVDVTAEILEWDEQAKEAGIICLLGMGSSPGVTNLLARYAYDHLLDETEAIDIYHAHGGEPFEGEGVVGHRLHCMSIDIPMFLEGEFKQVKFFEPEGIALREEVDFFKIGRHRVYPYPHPETITLPRFLGGLKRVTNKGTVLPDEYYELIMELCRLGLASKESIEVKGCKITPYDFALAYIIRERERILKETNFGSQKGCVMVVVSGKKQGRERKYIFSMASESQALGEGTGIPAALGAVLVKRGKYQAQGVVPPEAGIDPSDFLILIKEVLKIDKLGEADYPLVIEEVDESGQVRRLTV